MKALKIFWISVILLILGGITMEFGWSEVSSSLCLASIAIFVVSVVKFFHDMPDK